MILKMLDGGIENIIQDTWAVGGCETCDYGSSYTNELDIELTKFKIKASATKMYDYPLNDGELMKLFLQNVEEIVKMSEKEFTVWLKNKLNELSGRLTYQVTEL